MQGNVLIQIQPMLRLNRSKRGMVHFHMVDSNTTNVKVKQGVENGLQN